MIDILEVLIRINPSKDGEVFETVLEQHIRSSAKNTLSKYISTVDALDESRLIRMCNVISEALEEDALVFSSEFPKSVNLLLISGIELKETLYENVIKSLKGKAVTKDTFDLYFKLDDLNQYFEEKVPA